MIALPWRDDGGRDVNMSDAQVSCSPLDRPLAHDPRETSIFNHLRTQFEHGIVLEHFTLRRVHDEQANLLRGEVMTVMRLSCA
jgi:hypothetical protein